MNPAKLTSLYGILMFLIGSVALVRGWQGKTGAMVGLVVLVIMLGLAAGQRKGMRGFAILAMILGAVFAAGGTYMGLKAFGVVGGDDPQILKGSLQAAMVVVSVVFVVKMAGLSKKDFF
ncbi:MAG: hypothetical protein V3W41_22960 [Planctomycetota bacterium]